MFAHSEHLYGRSGIGVGSGVVSAALAFVVNAHSIIPMYSFIWLSLIKLKATSKGSGLCLNIASIDGKGAGFGLDSGFLPSINFNRPLKKRNSEWP